MPRRIRYVAWSPADGHRARRAGLSTWTSPWCTPGFEFDDLVASWRVDTDAGSWLEVAVQARGERRWHSLGAWERGQDAAHRSSRPGDPQVDTDVWHPSSGTDAFRLRATLHDSCAGQAPRIGRMGAVVSAGGVRATTSTPRRRVERVLDVPRLSQMAWAEVGGRGWCSPAAVSMLLAHAGRLPSSADTHPEPAHAEAHPDPYPRRGIADLAKVAREVFDPAYGGTGNWSFNVAWAATVTGAGFVTRLRDLRDAERFIDAGVPLAASVAYPAGALAGAPTRGTDGHLVVIRGFTAAGDVVTNDPAAPTARSVRRTYDRGQFERAWLGGSGGLVYVLHRPDQKLPPGPSAGA